MLQSKDIKVTYVSVSELKSADYNPRKWDEIAINQLKESIKRYGFVDPLIVNSAENRKNILIGGHFRLHIAKLLGYKEVPVVYINIPNIEKEQELNLRLNRNTGEWDFDLLKNFDVDFLLESGFSDSDLNAVWDDVLEIEEDDFNEEEELSKIKIPTVKFGQVYQLGKHRLICGDSTKPETFKQLLNDDKADIFYSDPPYNIGLDYNKGIGGRRNYGGNINDRKSVEEYFKFISSILENSLPYLNPNAHIFTWSDENYIWLVQGIYQKLNIDLKRVCLWIKNNQNATPNIAFNKVYEPCVYGTIGKPYLNKIISNLNEVLNKEVTSGNQLIDDIEDYLNIWLTKRLNSSEYEHPTQKPVTLHEKPLRRCSKVGDIVLDTFGGSGSTLIACEQMKRKAYLIEIEPIFCDLIIKRWEALTNEKAKLIN